MIWSFLRKSVSAPFKLVLSSVFYCITSFLCFFRLMLSVYSFSFSKVSMLCGTYCLREALLCANPWVNLDK